ncbi:HK97 gp10 family phage protein [Sphingomonas endolithica]|uniref:HK97 gp10 family phage protein n=1 Tax=Sphingomonas endolithica TaxID=2972485 RepID=UPI0021B0466A|nr:HK97 gp10 family phage protein [Sphingomonas sp. ZFBP2030]
MATTKGREAVQLYLAKVQEELTRSIYPGAARAAAKVVAAQVKANLGSKSATNANGQKVLIADAVKVKVRRVDGKYVAAVQLEGEGAYVARWLEYGTDPHFISVDDSVREGRSTRRINHLDRKAAKEGHDGPGRSLFINGKAIGTTVHHPGATPHPFLRPALDMMGDEARQAAREYIARRLKNVTKGIGHNGGPGLDDDDQE